MSFEFENGRGHLPGGIRDERDGREIVLVSREGDVKGKFGRSGGWESTW